VYHSDNILSVVQMIVASMNEHLLEEDRLGVLFIFDFTLGFGILKRRLAYSMKWHLKEIQD